MRIWDLEPKVLCRNHLLGEHRELHALWVIITQKKRGYSKHPETKRWIGKLKALFIRHEKLAGELKKRGYKHRSPLEKHLAVGLKAQTTFIDHPDKQIVILRNKKCMCFVK